MTIISVVEKNHLAPAMRALRDQPWPPAGLTTGPATLRDREAVVAAVREAAQGQ